MGSEGGVRWVGKVVGLGVRCLEVGWGGVGWGGVGRGIRRQPRKKNDFTMFQ